MKITNTIEETSTGTLTETLILNGTNYLILAPHGGDIEPYTKQQAIQTYQNLPKQETTIWYTDGQSTNNSAYDQFHITSTDITSDKFPALKHIENKTFRQAISFHGKTGPRLVIGGGETLSTKRKLLTLLQNTLNHTETTPHSQPTALQNYIQTEIYKENNKHTPITISLNKDGKYSGDHPRNITNRYTKNKQGIQLEQSYKTRKNHKTEIATVIANYLKNN